MKKHRVLTACSMILLAFILLSVYGKNKNPIKETLNVGATTEKEITDELVIALFIKEITDEVTGFYSEYYSGEIEVYNYEVMIVDVEKKEPGLITIKFGVTPQIGAHNPLGYDELSYFVDSMGNKKLSNYEHLKNYEAPERFQNYLIKPLE
ncbi:MAG: DUF3888 domain-containing protein [Lachnospiraceae bacterium]|nr:DUF3888 domain-containing protein [Lachnospiraceae bacterium]